MMTDPVADMLTRIRNAQQAQKRSVSIPYSRQKEALLRVLVEEGYVADCTVQGEAAAKSLQVTLKYYQGRSVIERVERVSRPGLRIYRRKTELPRVNSGLGVSIISTSKGIMTDRAARALGQGGEVLCTVY
jgi:small subunit ribosomal protein S8